MSIWANFFTPDAANYRTFSSESDTCHSHKWNADKTVCQRIHSLNRMLARNPRMRENIFKQMPQ